MPFLSIFATLAACVVSIPAWSLLLLSLFARSSRNATVKNVRSSKVPRVAVLVPAHNESVHIAPTIACVLAQLTPADRLLVVADNCSDDTAEQAMRAGANVLTRHDPSLRGKGYALAFGVDALRQDPPDVVVVVDADCLVSEGAIAAIAQRCAESGCPVQMLNLMHAPPGAGLRIRIQEFAWIVKNWVRALGSQRLGGTCHLMGTGMALPWTLMASAELATGHIAEDMKLGVDMALAGHPVQFLPTVQIHSMFPEDASALQAQKTRWEHGHLSIMGEQLPRLLAGAIRQRDAALAVLALDLTIPPIAFYFLVLVLSAVCLGAVQWWLPVLRPAFWVLDLAVLSFGIAIMLSWLCFGRNVVSLNELLSVPLYALRKTPAYVAFFIRKRSAWVRTPRR